MLELELRVEYTLGSFYKLGELGANKMGKSERERIRRKCLTCENAFENLLNHLQELKENYPEGYEVYSSYIKIVQQQVVLASIDLTKFRTSFL